MIDRDALNPPLYHPGALTAALETHHPAIIASAPAFLVAIAPAILMTAPMSLLQPLLVLAVVLLWMLLGVLTAVPTHMILRRTPSYELDGWVAVPFAAAFPLWGAIIALLSMGLLAPFTCTAAWCYALSPCLSPRRAMHLWAILAFVPVLLTAMLAIALDWAGAANPVTIVSAGIACWLALHPFALALATELCSRDNARAKLRCRACGYAREGLSPGTLCPECGLGG